MLLSIKLLDPKLGSPDLQQELLLIAKLYLLYIKDPDP